MNSSLKACLFSLTIITLLIGYSSKISAQDFSNVAANLEVTDQTIANGSIVEQGPSGIRKTTATYDQKMFGVAVVNSAIVIHAKTDTTRAIVTNGEALVQVTAKNGGINAGDFVTTSDVAGVGMKARDAGYVLGIARSSFTPANSNAVGTSNATGTVTVEVNIHFAAKAANELGNPIIRVFNAFTTSFEDQSRISAVIRYMIGAFVALMIFAIALFIFGRTIKSSIDAIGRNPLARSSVQFGLILSVAVTIVVSIIGFVITFLIIRL